MTEPASGPLRGLRQQNARRAAGRVCWAGMGRVEAVVLGSYRDLYAGIGADLQAPDDQRREG